MRPAQGSILRARHAQNEGKAFGRRRYIVKMGFQSRVNLSKFYACK